MTNFINGFCDVNGISMYYEIYGEGKPLVLIHGGGSTIQTSFANIIPLMSIKRKIIAIELQAHGRTNDRNQPSSFKQDAKDIQALLKEFKINNADFLGYSNGGHVLIEIALNEPQLVHKIIFASTFYSRDATTAEFWTGFDKSTLDNMPKALQEGFLAVNNDHQALLNMFNQDVQKMKNFKGWSKDQIKTIKCPVLIINGNEDVGSIEHSVEMHRLIPLSQLAIVPGKHGAYLGTIDFQDASWNQQYLVHIIENFLLESQQ